MSTMDSHPNIVNLIGAQTQNPNGKKNTKQIDVCDIPTLSVYPHQASLKNMPGHGGNR
jgi:hypothetical protein